MNRLVQESSDDQPAEAPRGDGRLISSFRCALAGIGYALRSQRNIRIHLAISVGVLALGAWLGLSWTEWAIISFTVALVLFAEMANTAAEAIVDLTTEAYHPVAKIGKDAAAGAVLVAAIGAVVVGLLVLGPHLLNRLSGWF